MMNTVECDWKLDDDGSGIWESYYRCRVCNKRVGLATDGDIGLPVRCFKGIEDLKALLCDYYDCLGLIGNKIELVYANLSYKMSIWSVVNEIVIKEEDSLFPKVIKEIRYNLSIFGDEVMSRYGNPVYVKKWHFVWTDRGKFEISRKHYDLVELDVMDMNYNGDINLFDLLEIFGNEMRERVPGYW